VLTSWTEAKRVALIRLAKRSANALFAGFCHKASQRGSCGKMDTFTFETDGLVGDSRKIWWGSQNLVQGGAYIRAQNEDGSNLRPSSSFASLTNPMREDVKKKDFSPPLGKMRVW
jgi:hypothetical protein